MAIYEYRCDTHGMFEISRPMGTAPASTPCEICGAHAARVMSAPMVLGSTRSAWSDAIERAEQSRHEPLVVSSVPAAGARNRIRTAPMTPALRGLPRPSH